MTLRVLHLHSSFDPGGKELRSVQLINAFGRGSSIASSRPCRGDGGGGAHPAGDQTDLAPDFPRCRAAHARQPDGAGPAMAGTIWC
jgi:hypothetical protein